MSLACAVFWLLFNSLLAVLFSLFVVIQRLKCFYTEGELKVFLNCYTLEISVFSNTQLPMFQNEIKSKVIDAGR